MKTGELFFLYPWSDVAKSDFTDFEFVITIAEAWLKFTFVSLRRQPHQMHIVKI